MPGINTTGKPSPSDYNLGRGAVLFGTVDATTGKPKEYRHLGHATEFNITVESETLEHQSSREGLKVTDKEVVVSQKASLSITLDEINFDNLALFASGEADSTVANPIQTADAVFTLGEAFKGGRWYDLRSAAGARCYDLLTLTPVTFASGTYTEGTDYELDRVLGRIFIVKSGGLDGTTVVVTVKQNASAVATVDRVKALVVSTVTGALKFRAENPANNDHVTEYQFHSVNLKAEGDFSLIGDEFTTMQLTGVAERNEKADADSPTLTIITHANA
jgi:hypothetical protein